MKKTTLYIIAVVLIGLGAFVAIKGKDYYEHRYVGTDYYVQIPSNQDMEVEDILDSNGKKQAVGKNYRLTGYDAKGNEKVLDFSVTGEQHLLKPNTFLKISASEEIVLKIYSIEKSEIPPTALEKIQKNHK